MQTKKPHATDIHNRAAGFSEVIFGAGPADPETDDGILLADGELAIDGGKLPGKHDDFDGELDQNREVPGAHGDGALRTPNPQDFV